ncbi:hypothetical protein JNM05_11870 [bacterium]|nr:hypothetical protein [bacterium]
MFWISERYGLQSLYLFISLALFFLPVCGQQLSGPSVNVPLGHFSYDLIEKLETNKVIVPRIELRNKPYTRNIVLKIILELDDKLEINPRILSTTDRGLFLKLKGEFHFELSQSKRSVEEAEKERHFLHFESHKEEDLSYTIGDVLAEQAVDVSRYGGRGDTLSDNISLTRVSGRVRGVLRNALAFYSDFSSTLIRGSDRSYSIGENSQGGVINFTPASENVYSLNSTAYVAIEPKWFRIQFGKDAISLGPGKHSNLFLSDNAGSFDNLRMDVTFDRIKFTYLHGWLRSQPLIYNRDGNIGDKKFIVAHRLEFKVFPWLFLAGNESVVYGGRGTEVGYLNPIIPYHIAEQYLGDKDNNTISFDATAFPFTRLKSYAALFLDDFSTSLPISYWKQTWAVMCGFYWSEPFQIADADLRFEYTRIEPYVYTHKFPLIRYSHFGSSIGSSIPPNSDDYFVEIRYRPLRKISAGLDYELLRHGKGSIDRYAYEDGFVDAGNPGKKTKKFLQGVNETKNIISFQFQWETFHQQYFYLTYQHTRIRGFENIRNRTAIQNRLLIGYKLDY